MAENQQNQGNDNHDSDHLNIAHYRMDRVIDLQEFNERRFWKYRGLLKALEIVMFVGMFLAQDPIMHRMFVIGSATCHAADFYLNYEDYNMHKSFNKVLA